MRVFTKYIEQIRINSTYSQAKSYCSIHSASLQRFGQPINLLSPLIRRYRQSKMWFTL